MRELVCSHLKLPVVALEDFEKVVTPYVQDISHDEWIYLDAYDSGSEVSILLADMCHAVIGEISALILQGVEPQALASKHYHSSGDDGTVQDGSSHCRVTEQDVQACFRNSLHCYFGEALDVAEESSHNLDQLVRLFSAEITKTVNSSLAQLTWSAFVFNIYDSVTAECILPIVHNVGEMFKYMLDGCKRMEDESCDEVACPRCNCEVCWRFDSQDAKSAGQDSTETLERSDSSSESSDHTNDLTPERAPQFSDYSESYHFVSSSSHPPCPEVLINETFLTVVLAKLVDHIAAKTRASILNMDLDQLVHAVTRRTRGTMFFTLPKRADSLHISIYKKLCKKFRSKYVLQAIMESGDEAFEFAVSVTLMSLLQNLRAPRKDGTPFNPGNLSPVPEIQTPEPDGEESSGKLLHFLRVRHQNLTVKKRENKHRPHLQKDHWAELSRRRFHAGLLML
ncbi:uncharacterized protein LOC115773058 [Archocentrus centrarchus]|uniref:uncharacterized protein LOC115773058 n=1 Tax=Archocentrus centrarchus TaxID=63155 RepID=UPI0011E9F3CD|nr:uncharacterized protein LOC115773058 [Archocentrus centrarchus]